MKYLVALVVFLTACSLKQESKILEIEIVTPKQGVRVYNEQGSYLGKSPVVITKEVKVESVGEGIFRYFLGSQELHPGESWPLSLKFFKQGVKTPAIVRVLFEPRKLKQRVEIKQ